MSNGEVDFNALLKTSVEDAERPPTFPIGNYESIITGHEIGKSAKKGTPYVRFFIKLLNPTEDVDPELFQDCGGIAKLSDRKAMPKDFYITGDALYRLREFLEGPCQLSCGGRAFDEVIPEATNVTLLSHVAHRQGQGAKENETYMDLDDFASAA